MIAAVTSALARGPAQYGPIVPGDVFRYSYTLSGTRWSPPATPAPFASSGTFSVEVKGDASFNRMNGLLALRSFYSDGRCSEGDTAFIGFVPGVAGSTNEIYYGDECDNRDAAGDVTEQVDAYAQGLVADEYPENAGLRWSPFAARTYAAKYSAGDFSERTGTDATYGADGSNTVVSYDIENSGSTHTSSSLSSMGVARSRTDDEDASGTVEKSSSELFGAPLVAGSGYAIPVTTQAGGTDYATPPPALTADVPDWYPGHHLAYPLQTGSVTDLGVARTPRACMGRANLQAVELQTVEHRTDPLAGSTTAIISDSYDEGGRGTICTVIVTDISYYDNLRTGRFLGNSVTTLTTLLESVSGPGTYPFDVPGRRAASTGIVAHLPLQLLEGPGRSPER